jgi:telomerase Cajal body protein 1
LFPATKGIISAVSVSSKNILGAGTFNNIVSLFSLSYEHISTFQTSHGTGITEVKWSPDSRYIYIIPRQSQDIEVWDIRSTGDVVAILNERQALTNQRIWTDISRDGRWFISGGTDGMVKGWNTDSLSGNLKPSFEFIAHEGK